MKRHVLHGLCLALCIWIPAFAAASAPQNEDESSASEQTSVDRSAPMAEINRLILSIDNDVQFLKSRNADMSDLNPEIAALKKAVSELAYVNDGNFLSVADLIRFSAHSVERNARLKMTYIKRTEFLYLLMLGFATLSILFLIGYFVFVRSRMLRNGR